MRGLRMKEWRRSCEEVVMDWWESGERLVNKW